MLKGTKGVAGFFVDIPALLAIIIGLWLFTFSLYSSHSRYIEEAKMESMHVKLEDFIRIVRNHELLARSPGVVCGEKLDTLNVSYLMESFDRYELGYNYQIDILDESAYADSFSLSVGSAVPPEDKNIYSRTSSIVIASQDGSMHLSSLQIRIWGLE